MSNVKNQISNVNKVKLLSESTSGDSPVIFDISVGENYIKYDSLVKICKRHHCCSDKLQLAKLLANIQLFSLKFFRKSEQIWRKKIQQKWQCREKQVCKWSKSQEFVVIRVCFFKNALCFNIFIQDLANDTT